MVSSFSTHLLLTLTQIIQVLIAWEVVPNDVMGLPPSKKREARSNFHLYRVIQNKEVAGGNVANLIPVINILGSGREDGLQESGHTFFRKNDPKYRKDFPATRSSTVLLN